LFPELLEDVTAGMREADKMIISLYKQFMYVVFVFAFCLFWAAAAAAMGCPV
jgi:hypothetical protein